MMDPWMHDGRCDLLRKNNPNIYRDDREQPIKFHQIPDTSEKLLSRNENLNSKQSMFPSRKEQKSDGDATASSLQELSERAVGELEGRLACIMRESRVLGQHNIRRRPVLLVGEHSVRL
ncbi:hypothetical protein K0M31_016046 [Melipona bicolor]|uniref:Uncharacterized protein n=1 Tax=Melipona bicolor TaxID=60889 RepID=A0AA40G713_9HYME|nr:hypothetical protein K0M31_016046 [Melipona bicolor]